MQGERKGQAVQTKNDFLAGLDSPGSQPCAIASLYALVRAISVALLPFLNTLSIYGQAIRLLPVTSSRAGARSCQVEVHCSEPHRLVGEHLQACSGKKSKRRGTLISGRLFEPAIHRGQSNGAAKPPVGGAAIVRTGGERGADQVGGVYMHKE